MHHRLTRSALVVVLLAGLLSLLPPVTAPTTALAAPAAEAAPSQCAVLTDQEAALDAQVAAINAQVDALTAQIAAHNAQVIDTTSAAAVAAYNAVADDLNAQKDALNAQVRALNDQVSALQTRASACEASLAAALVALEGNHANGWSYRPSPGEINALTQALAGVPRDVPPPAPNAAGQYRNNPQSRLVFGPIRNASPPRDVRPGELQGQPVPAVGDPDPAYPGATIGGTTEGTAYVAVDHIIPLLRIMALPGFLDLNPTNMLYVINAPVNLQYLSRTANSSKGSGQAGLMNGVDPQWRSDQQELEDSTITALQTAIDELLELQQNVTG